MEGESQVTTSEPAQTDAASSNGRTSDFGSENTGSIPEAATTENTEHDGKPQGFDRVEFTPEQKSRVDRIYGNMKRYENDSKELREQNQALMKSLEQLYQGQSQIVNHLQTSDFQDAERNLQSQRDQAWKTGDLEGYHKANDQLVEIKSRKAFAENQARQQPRVQQPIQQPRMSGERMVDTAVQSGEINPVDTNIARSWMAETDAAGNIKRSWTQETDPRNYEAALVGKAVFESPAWVGKPMAEKLREIDRRMGVQPQQQSGQNVLGSGNLTRGNSRSNIKLNDVERNIAIRTKFGGSKAKSDEDHAAAYLQAKIKSQPKGASR